MVDDEPPTLRMLTRILRKEGYEVDATTDGEEALEWVQTRDYHLVLTDLVISEVDGLQILAAAKERMDPGEVIILTGYASVPTALEAMRNGAFDYIQKPVTPDDVRQVVRKALEKKGFHSESGILVQTLHTDFPQIIGDSAVMQSIKAMLEQIAHGEANVLVTGESGTGKEVIARSIHQLSPRAGQRFVAFNCAALSEDLVANELFGHERGAYTGATDTHGGLLESADGGTVFFDEIAEMPMTMQAKLLRAIQEREVLRVGGTDPVAVNIRIIAATNQDLRQRIADGRFREDLFFRLNVIPIHLPPLRERREDIRPLAGHFLRKVGYKTGKRLGGFSEEALGWLEELPLPGNVRELENLVERAVTLAGGLRIERHDLTTEFQVSTRSNPEDEGPLKTLQDVENEYIDKVLRLVGNNKSKAAKILGIDRVSLYRRLKRG